MPGFLHSPSRFKTRICRSVLHLMPATPCGYIFPLAFMVFLFYKISWLDLPLYWDEAWSYGSAIFAFHKEGIWFLPGNADPGLTRGHPLLFYQLAVLWIHLAGTSLISVHLFALLLSCLLIAALYSMCSDLFDQTTARTVSLLLLLQPLFLAQSTLLLPEVLLALLTLMTVHSYFKKRWKRYILSASLLVLTKESGMVAVAALIVDKLIFAGHRLSRLREKEARQGNDKFLPRDQKDRSLILTETLELLMIFIPVFVFISFLAIQKIRYGWFLYPEHTRMITAEGKALVAGLKQVFSRLFLQTGRNVFLLLFMPCLAYYFFFLKPDEKHKHFIRFSFIFILMYGVFSAFNFFTVRYILSPLPFYLITGLLVLQASMEKRKVLRGTILFLLVAVFLYNGFAAPPNESDASRGFRNTILVQREAVRYAVTMQWNDKLIYTTFLMQYYLSDPNLGYIDDASQRFTRVSNKNDLSYDLYLFCSNENDPLYRKICCNADYQLIRRFELKGSWVEYYRPAQKN